ncbi:TetR/AcrR family transcriptional regulator [Crossiella sp. SN42]|uniref:TetR/AcrR family transcriptional regulator n=1 Tax=Crossiella sp. SN42 TaxID=2944808 RepID=UPI00207D53D7|nr:TetR/AcrR family transcriptional regulator [Crossiella sp. SN42]MCO1577866.1 TetR/AcrR family transcriptional regulator [Crossiella sp. SN42]
MPGPDPLRRDQRARQAVLDAAWELLAADGWGGISVDRIAVRAGVGKQTVYRWWRGKGEVVLEAFLARSPRETGEPLTGELELVLRELARRFVRLYAGTLLGDRLRELLGAAQHDPELAGAVRERWFRPRREPVRLALAFSGLDARLDAEAVLDLLFGPLHYRLLTGHGPLDRDYADAVAGLVSRAVRG